MAVSGICAIRKRFGVAAGEGEGQLSMMADEKVLVTGASGFIGSACILRLKQAGIPMVATTRSPSPKLEMELGIPVSRLNVMEELPVFDGVHTVIHAATPNDIRSKEADGAIPLAVMGTHNLIDHAAKSGVKRFIFLSTIQVYGTELFGEVDETTPQRCETLYGLNHYLGEEVCRHYALSKGMDVVILRPSNVYGVPLVSTVDRWTLVPMCFVKEAQEEGSITLRSSGKQMRNFVSLDEVTDVILRVLQDFPKGYTIINAGSHWHCSILEVAQMVAEKSKEKEHREIAIRIMSKVPEIANKFCYQSDRFPSSFSVQESRHHMKTVIKNLFAINKINND